MRVFFSVAAKIEGFFSVLIIYISLWFFLNCWFQNNNCSNFWCSTYESYQDLTSYCQNQLFELYFTAVSEIQYLVGLLIYKLRKFFGLCHKSPKPMKISENYKQDSLITNVQSYIKYLSLWMHNLHQTNGYSATSRMKLRGTANFLEWIAQSHYEISHLWLRIIDRLVLFVTHINFGRLRTFLRKSEIFSKLITRKSDDISKFWNRHEIELKKMVLEIQGQISVILSVSYTHLTLPTKA